MSTVGVTSSYSFYKILDCFYSSQLLWLSDSRLFVGRGFYVIVVSWVAVINVFIETRLLYPSQNECFWYHLCLELLNGSIVYPEILENIDFTSINFILVSIELQYRTYNSLYSSQIHIFINPLTFSISL